MKKIPALCLFLFCTAALSFAQIYKGEAETVNGSISFSFHYVEYADYRCLLFIDGVSIFLEEDNIGRLETILIKFTEWEQTAAAEQIALTKTIDSITFSGFHFNHTFFREPLIFYFVFTGGPVERHDDFSGDETPLTRYTLFIDTTLDRIVPFRLSSATIEEMLFALSPDQLGEAWDAWERQKALEEMFN